MSVSLFYLTQTHCLFSRHFFFSPSSEEFLYLLLNPLPVSGYNLTNIEDWSSTSKTVLLKQLLFPWSNTTSLLFHAVHHSSPSACHCYGSGMREWFFILFLSPTTIQKRKKICTHTFKLYKCRGLMSRMTWLHIFSAGIASTSRCEQIVPGPWLMALGKWHWHQWDMDDSWES